MKEHSVSEGYNLPFSFILSRFFRLVPYLSFPNFPALIKGTRKIDLVWLAKWLCLRI